MNKLTKILVSITLGLFASVGFANHFKIQNHTGYVVEFSGLMGGYSSANPLTGARRKKSETVLLPYPGSKLLRGHIMIYAKNRPGHYVDNIVFQYQKVKRHWVFKVVSLYHGVGIKVKPETMVLGD